MPPADSLLMLSPQVRCCSMTCLHIHQRFNVGKSLAVEDDDDDDDDLEERSVLWRDDLEERSVRAAKRLKSQEDGGDVSYVG